MASRCKPFEGACAAESQDEQEKNVPAGLECETRVKRLIAHYEKLSDEEQAAEDEQAAGANDGQTVISVPDELLPAIRELLASRNDKFGLSDAH